MNMYRGAENRMLCHGRKAVGGNSILWTAALILWVATGCGSKRTLGQVEGKVTLDGKPFSNCVVVFNNMSAGVFMTAEPANDGSFTVEMAEGIGLPLGEYELSVKPAPPKSWDRPPERSPIPPRYWNPKTSGLTLLVVEGVNSCEVPLHTRK